jgi:hypothetical protein
MENMRKRDVVVLAAVCGFVVLCAGAGRFHSRTQMCTVNMKRIHAAIAAYADAYDGRLPQLEYNAGTGRDTQQHPFWAFRDGAPGGPWSTAIDLGCLFRAGIVTDPATLYCPADGRWADSMKTYATGGQWGVKIPTLPVYDPFIGGPSSTVCLRLNIAYWPQSKNLIPDATRLAQIQRLDFYNVGQPDIAYKITDLATNRAYVSDDGRHTMTGSINGQQEGTAHNALFGDGHIVFAAPPKDLAGIVYKIRQDNEDVGTVNGVSNNTGKYFFLLQP